MDKLCETGTDKEAKGGIVSYHSLVVAERYAGDNTKFVTVQGNYKLTGSWREEPIFKILLLTKNIQQVDPLWVKGLWEYWEQGDKQEW